MWSTRYTPYTVLLPSQIYRTPYGTGTLHSQCRCPCQNFRVYLQVYLHFFSRKDSLIKRRGRGGAQYAPHSGEGRTGALRRVRGSSCAHRTERSQVPLHSVRTCVSGHGAWKQVCAGLSRRNFRWCMHTGAKRWTAAGGGWQRTKAAASWKRAHTTASLKRE